MSTSKHFKLWQTKAQKYYLLVVLSISVLGLSSSNTATAQSLYGWAHKISISTTAQDSIWSAADAWYDVSFYTDSLAIWYKIGAPDTASWSSRDWIFLPEGSSVYIGPSTRLRRFEFKTVVSSSKLYMIGRKRRRQY